MRSRREIMKGILAALTAGITMPTRGKPAELDGEAEFVKNTLLGWDVGSKPSWLAIEVEVRRESEHHLVTMDDIRQAVDEWGLDPHTTMVTFGEEKPFRIGYLELENKTVVVRSEMFGPQREVLISESISMIPWGEDDMPVESPYKDYFYVPEHRGGMVWADPGPNVYVGGKVMDCDAPAFGYRR